MSHVFDIFDRSDLDALKTLIDKLEQSSFDYMKLESEGINITIGKNGYEDAPVIATPPISAAVPAAAPAPAAAAETAVEEQTAAEPAPASEPAPMAAPADDLVYIKCPSYGLFYAQSEPGAPAYVKLGDHLNVGDTVGLLEIMKTYTAITTNIAGTVVEILVNNQDAVEPDQPLFALKAD